ncbi:MAG: vitamin K epoxide reductase family protein [Thermomicrobiales bacterium]|nr:vitamin K epoxide reductase family protein [Thermomicrobiales bacterium]
MTRSSASSDSTGNWPRALGAIVGLSILGIIVAAYLTYTHFNESALVCAVGDCGTVQKSKYATIGPVPIALLGLGMYVALAVSALGRMRGKLPVSFEVATMASWGIALAGFAYAAYLTYLEIWVIKAICQWCVASAIITTVILAIESVLLWRVLGAEE